MYVTFQEHIYQKKRFSYQHSWREGKCQCKERFLYQILTVCLVRLIFVCAQVGRCCVLSVVQHLQEALTHVVQTSLWNQSAPQSDQGGRLSQDHWDLLDPHQAIAWDRLSETRLELDATYTSVLELIRVLDNCLGYYKKLFHFLVLAIEYFQLLKLCKSHCSLIKAIISYWEHLTHSK